MIKFIAMKKLIVASILTVATVAVAAMSSVADTASATSCTNGTKYTDFDGSRSGNTLTVWPKKQLCKDVNVNFTTFKVLNSKYNGEPFKNNPTAIPQAYYWNKTVTLKKGSASKVSVAMQAPDACTPYQIDAYIGPVQKTITTSEGLVGTNAIIGKIFDRTKTDCSVPKVDACNTTTGVIEKVEKGKENVAPYTTDLTKCTKVTACNLKTLKIEQNVPKAKIDDVNYTLDLTKCYPPEEKKIEVCRLSDKKYPVTIKESEFDSSKYSKDPKDCEAEDKEIQVCRLSDKTYPVTIKESEFDSTKYSKSASDCAEEPAPKCEIAGKEDLPADSEDCKEDETPEELPHTGPVESFASLLGAGALAGTATTYFRSRRK
jgi:hypothetical protein